VAIPEALAAPGLGNDPAMLGLPEAFAQAPRISPLNFFVLEIMSIKY